MLHQCIEVHVNYGKARAVQTGAVPMLYTYLLDKSEAIPLMQKRPAVIICPGGAYFFKSDREAEPVAMRFLAAGINAFVLQYSVAPSRYPSAALELAAAVALVRDNAESWGIIPDRIFIAGFSAGGHLCATLGTLWDEPVFEQAFDFVKGQEKNWRPDGMILCYPVITFGEYGHKGSRANLLGPDATEELAGKLSLETRVGVGTVPAFLWHTYEDDSVPVENSLQYAMALRKAKVPFEMHIYEKGGHGLSLCDETTSQYESQLVPDDTGWIHLAIRWVKRGNR